MKELHIICDEVGPVGNQIAGNKQRAVYLWAAKHNDGKTTGLTAYSAVNDTVPDWEPENSDAWQKADDELLRNKKAERA